MNIYTLIKTYSYRNQFMSIDNYPISYSTVEKVKFYVKDFLSKYDKIHKKLRIWSHLLRNSLMENFVV